jgi:hypothetical protein
MFSIAKNPLSQSIPRRAFGKNPGFFVRSTEFSRFVRATRNAGPTPITPRFDYELKCVIVGRFG